MPTYTTLPELADLVKGKTQAYKIIPVSEDVDLAYWWIKTGGNPTGKLKVTLKKGDGTLVVKLSDTGDVQIVNSSPQRIKVLINPSDIDFVGDLKLFPEFKIDDSWIQADLVSVKVEVNPVEVVE